MERVILKSGRVRHEDSSHARHAAAVARGSAPEVRLVELEGVVHAIEVRCACGSIVTVELDVQAESSGATESRAADRGGAA